jgi:prophage antirepressor-like protein
MNELQIFNNSKFGQVRTVEINGKIYFVAIDVTKSLGYKNPNDAVTRHCKGYVKYAVLTNGGTQEMNVIPEGDIYRLAANSELPGADEFESWIFDEVLPSIRKTGGYVGNDEMFINTYLPFADDTTRVLFKTTLQTVRKQNELIQKQQKEIQHKEDVIIGLVDSVELAEKRQTLNRVVRHNGANFQERWKELYRQFEMKYHINIKQRMESYNSDHKPKMKSYLGYVDMVMNKVPELYEIACKLYENDIKELTAELYDISKPV